MEFKDFVTYTSKPGFKYREQTNTLSTPFLDYSFKTITELQITILYIENQTFK